MEYVMFQETGAVNTITSKGNAGRSVEFKTGREQNFRDFDRMNFVDVLFQSVSQSPPGFSPSI